MNTQMHTGAGHLATTATPATHTRGLRLRRALGGLALALIVAVLGYLLLRPTLLRWGATDTEVASAMPGDLDGLRWTRAVAIDAAPESVWPYLVQWGQGRGGWYSYDWLEDLLGFLQHAAAHQQVGSVELHVGLVDRGELAELAFGKKSQRRFVILRGHGLPRPGQVQRGGQDHLARLATGGLVQGPGGLLPLAQVEETGGAVDVKQHLAIFGSRRLRGRSPPLGNLQALGILAPVVERGGIARLQ